MQPPILIRLGDYADSDQIAEFMIKMAWETEGISLDPKTVRHGVRNVFKELTRGFYTVAECGDKVVGCMMVTYEWSDWRNANQWWIQSVYVLPEHRRSGVFKKLYEFTIYRAHKEQDVCGLRLYVEKGNSVAQDTYRALGMKFSDYLVFEAPIVNHKN